VLIAFSFSLSLNALVIGRKARLATPCGSIQELPAFAASRRPDGWRCFRGLFYDAVCNAVLLPIYAVFLPVFLRRFCADFLCGFLCLDFGVWRGFALT
jgi:hypothetical protein